MFGPTVDINLLPGCRGVEGVVGKAEDAFFSTAVSAFGSASAEMIHEETCSDWRTWESVLGPWLERRESSHLSAMLNFSTDDCPPQQQ